MDNKPTPQKPSKPPPRGTASADWRWRLYNNPLAPTKGWKDKI